MLFWKHEFYIANFVSFVWTFSWNLKKVTSCAVLMQAANVSFGARIKYPWNKSKTPKIAKIFARDFGAPKKTTFFRCSQLAVLILTRIFCGDRRHRQTEPRGRYPQAAKILRFVQCSSLEKNLAHWPSAIECPSGFFSTRSRRHNVLGTTVKIHEIDIVDPKQPVVLIFRFAEL